MRAWGFPSKFNHYATWGVHQKEVGRGSGASGAMELERKAREKERASGRGGCREEAGGGEGRPTPWSQARALYSRGFREEVGKVEGAGGEGSGEEGVPE